MSQRLAPIDGEWLDRSQRLSFRFEGKRYRAFGGDTISSALLAEGVTLLGRSFKYHRPRGVMSFANHDANVMVQAAAIPNVRADVTAVADGMELAAVNTFGGLVRDRARFLDRFSAFLPVGFYYKAFHSKRWFPMWERIFRRTAGLGRVHALPSPVKTPKRYGFCDVLVIGGGPSGLAAALAAAEAGCKVAIAEEDPRLGGSGLYDLGADPQPRNTVAELVKQAQAHPHISALTGTYAAGYYADHWIPLIDAARMTKMRARAVVFCTGAYEQPAVFHNNDLPGVMLGSAAQRLIYRHAVKAFDRVVVLGANAAAYRAALDFDAHDMEVVALVDLRQSGEPSSLAQDVLNRGIAVYPGHFVAAARGRGRVSAVEIRPLDDRHGSSRVLGCDGLAISVGYAPASNLLYQAGVQMKYEEKLEQFIPKVLPSGVFAAGKVNGFYGLLNRIRDGRNAGLEAARHLGFAGSTPVIALPREDVCPNHPYPIFPHAKGKSFVDFDEDVVLADIANAVQEGFDNIELLKRFTTVGMGCSQGKHSNMNAIRVLARIRGESIDEIGTTTSRPFFHPVPMAVLAGRAFHPERVTPLQRYHEAAAARFMSAGQWWRPEYYARAGKSREQCILEEVLAVRTAVGVIDVGTLGKIEVFGPGAAELLERIYTGRFANLSVGMTRYAVMLDEAGTVIDDGVVARIADDQFYFTTTTSGSAAVYRELCRLNAIWRLDCGIVNQTSHMGAANVAGPRSQKLLSRLTHAELSNAAFPYLGVRDIEVAGVPVRAMRVGFVGEFGFELHAAAGSMGPLWQALIDAGEDLGIRPFGVEAQRVLRLEKGHLIVGQDTDGLTTPFEAGCTWAVRMDKPFFVGQRSLRIIQASGPRQVLIGFHLPEEPPRPVLECHLVIEEGEVVGRVTSVAKSPTLRRHVGLAMLRPDIANRKTHFHIRTADGTLVKALITATPFYDAEGKRQKLAEAA